MPKKQAVRHQKSLRKCEILEENHCASVPKLVEAENEAILVEVENRTWYNSLKGYGLRIALFV